MQTTGARDPRSFSKEYAVKHGGPEPSKDVPDIPDFVVDQRFVPLEMPPYPA